VRGRCTKQNKELMSDLDLEDGVWSVYRWDRSDCWMRLAGVALESYELVSS